MAVKAKAEITISKIIDIDKVVRYYLLQSSTLAAPSKPADGAAISSKWSKTEPSYTSGSTSTLYFVDQTVMSNGALKYSEVSKSSSYEAAKEAWNKANSAQNSAASANNKIDGLKVGGRNIAEKTNQGVTGWLWSMKTGGYSMTEIVENGVRTCKIVRNNVVQSGWSVIQYGNIGRAKWKPNTVYTITMYVKGSVSTHINPYFREPDGTDALGTVTAVKNKIVANEWQKLEWRFKTANPLPSSANQTTYFSDMNSDVGVWYQFKDLKIEEGNIATDWTPAPEDLESRVTSAESSISNNSKEIKLKASQETVTALSKDYNAYKKTTTEFTQDIDGWRMNWNKLISTDEAELASHQDYITFQKGNILLGDSASNLKLKLTKNSIQFKGTGDTEVTPDSDATAWITGKTFHIDTGEIQSSLKFGGILMKPTSSGNLAIGSAAEFGSTVRIGLATGRNTTIDSNGLKVSYRSTEIAQIGYDAVKDRNGKDVDAPFYTFGLRITSEVGAYSHAEGNGVIASGNAAHAEGENTKAIGNESHAEGNNTRASSTGSHAEGSGTIASGLGSHAEGSGTRASGHESHAGGYGTIAASEYQTAIGTCNITDSENRYLFIIGNGTLTERSNAFTVSRSGDVEAAGGLHTKGSEYLDMNNTSIYGTFTDGSNSEILRLNTNDELLIGYGQYGKASVATRLYGGNKIAFHLKNPAASWIPYYTKGDSVSVKIYQTGFITNNGKELMFFIPLSRPIVGVSAVAISSIDGLTVRQNGDYCFSKIISSSPVKPNSYSASVVGGGCGINIKATFTDTTNVRNNDSCGVYASIKITFS